jgi:hypothetical protein
MSFPLLPRPVHLSSSTSPSSTSVSIWQYVLMKFTPQRMSLAAILDRIIERFEDVLDR